MQVVPAQALTWIEARLDSAVTVTRLAGGADALTLRCDTADGRAATARLLPDPTVAAKQPLSTDIAMLSGLAGRGLPIPGVIAADETGEQAGCPALLLTWIEGRPVADPYGGPASALAVIDAVCGVHAAPVELFAAAPAGTGERVLGEPRRSLVAHPLGGPLWSELQRLLPDPRRPLVPTHGDCWAGNLIWRHGRLNGIVDWSDAQRSDPASDLAMVRLDVALLHGSDAADALPAEEHQRFWDLLVLTGWMTLAHVWWPFWRDLGLQLSLEELRQRVSDHAGHLLDSHA